MNPIRNPYAPGAGTKPPELAGRGHIIEDALVQMQRLKEGRSGKCKILLGLRGVGKTVLLDRIQHETAALGAHGTTIEASEERSLPAMLAPSLRQTLHAISRREAA